MVPEFLLHLKEIISQPWPWYVAGPLLAILMFMLLYFGHEFGISENFRIMCAADGAGELNEFFKFDWVSGGWNLMVALGAVFGGYLAAHYFVPTTGNIAHVSTATVNSLNQMGFNVEEGKVPLVPYFYDWQYLFTWRGLLIIAGGGFLVGFGARYAGGCTSGHAISGLSALQLPSLIAVIGFFMGGLVMTWLIFPLIFPWIH
ncbi:MAG TPA: YeeE/YedE thiosulfate transporter family protein [Bacteroidia bacterium]|mgnify:CR=1 FL=1|nr:YeeE/YedE thiosulfate transporter family protein [Bacteroidia bacterium]HNP97416.1 YeeE/YedE thiosulfate transporter family protein [Bacteroidia bacterium]